MTSIFHPSSDLHKGLWKPKTLLTSFEMPKGFKPQVTETLYTEIDEDSPSDLDFIYLQLKVAHTPDDRRYTCGITSPVKCLFDPAKTYRCTVRMRLRADTTPISLVPYCHSNFLVTVASNATVRYAETQSMPMPFGGGSFVDKVFHFANTAIPGGDLQDDKLSCSIEPATDTNDYYMSCSWLVVEFTEAANVVTV